MTRFFTSLAVSVSILFAIVVSSSAASSPAQVQASLGAAPGISLTMG